MSKPSAALFHFKGVLPVPATLFFHGLLCSGSRAQLAPLSWAIKENFASSRCLFLLTV